MPLAPCPERLRKYIRRLNQESGVHAQHLKLILQAIQNSQQDYVVTLPSTVTIDLTNFDYHIRNDLTDVLRAIDPPELIARIRECQAVVKKKICGDLFWAGRDDKKACDKHVGRVRQRKHRRDIKGRKVAADMQRRKEEATKTLDGMTKTAQAVIRAVMTTEAVTLGAIDATLWTDSYNAGEVPRPELTVHQVTHKLHEAGYLEYHESADRRNKRGFSRADRYLPTQKLIDLWNDSRSRTEQQS